MYTHDQHQRPKAHKMDAFQVWAQAISSKYPKIIIKVQAFQVQTQAISSIYQNIIIKVQAHQVLSILNGPRRSKWPNFASLHIWFATSWLSLKFVCLFHVSMFSWIQKFHVAFNELCLCIYILKKKTKTKKFKKKFNFFFKISKSFPKKKEKNLQKKKKKRVFGLGALSP